MRAVVAPVRDVAGIAGERRKAWRVVECLKPFGLEALVTEQQGCADRLALGKLVRHGRGDDELEQINAQSSRAAKHVRRPSAAFETAFGVIGVQAAVAVDREAQRTASR